MKIGKYEILHMLYMKTATIDGERDGLDVICYERYLNGARRLNRWRKRKRKATNTPRKRQAKARQARQGRQGKATHHQRRQRLHTAPQGEGRPLLHLQLIANANGTIANTTNATNTADTAICTTSTKYARREIGRLGWQDWDRCIGMSTV